MSRPSGVFDRQRSGTCSALIVLLREREARLEILVRERRELERARRQSSIQRHDEMLMPARGPILGRGGGIVLFVPAPHGGEDCFGHAGAFQLVDHVVRDVERLGAGPDRDDDLTFGFSGGDHPYDVFVREGLWRRRGEQPQGDDEAQRDHATSSRRPS
jgi:hypothetical protein